MKLKFVTAIIYFTCSVFYLGQTAYAQWELPKAIDGQSAGTIACMLGTSHASSLIANGSKLYATWSEQDNFGHHWVYTNSSNDSGTTWSTPVKVTDTPMVGKLPYIASSGSRLHIIFYNYQGTLHTYSTNGGQTWSTPTFIDTSLGSQYFSCSSIAASGSNVLIAYSRMTDVGGPIKGFIRRSTNEGDSWSAPIEISEAGDSINHTSLAIGGANTYCAWFDKKGRRIKIRHSSDFGATWGNATTVSSDPTTADNFMISANGNNVDIPIVHATYQYIGGASYNWEQIFIAQSSDLGASFSIKQVSMMYQFYYSSFGAVNLVRDGNRIHILTYKGKAYRSDDGGTTWPGEIGNMSCMHVARTGEILHTINIGSGVMYSRNLHGNRPLYTSVHSGVNTQLPMQVYPNPSSGSIFFNLKKEAENNIYELRIINALGQEVSTNTIHGNTPFEFDSRTVSPGIYFYLLKYNGEDIQSGKILVN
ncbi:MAG: T9SS type A sorting domain-containing protein [Bacteroidia bacterium]|nr:T9SS type A sorting domain-containing protein [Bacteroidia bacterium]